MMIITKRTCMILAAALCVVWLFACSDGSSPNNNSGATNNPDAVLVSRLDQGVSYLQAIRVDETSGSVSPAKAKQIITDWAFTYSHGGALFVAGFDMNEVSKYSVGSDGSLTKEARLSIPANSWPAGLVFANKTKAYVSLYSIGHVVVFNPQTMEKISEIDLTSYAVGNCSVSPANMIIHGNHLVVSLHQMKGEMSFDTKAHAVLIDLEADTVLTHIVDERASWLGSREALSSMFVDEKGDLYMSGSAMFGMVSSAPEGVLRIRAGATDFDPDYFWDISKTEVEGEPEKAAGKTVALYATTYLGGTKGVGIIGNMGYMAEGEDMMTGHYFKPAAFDFSAKTMKVLDIPAGGGYGHGMTFHEGKVLFAFETATDKAVYRYDPEAEKVTKLFDMDVSPCYITTIVN